MAFLTIAGQTILVDARSTGELAPTEIGAMARAYSGNLRTSIRATKRAWQFQTVEWAQSNIDTFKANCLNGAIVACNGDFNNNVAVNCKVTFLGTAYVPGGGGYRVASFRMDEV